MGSLGVDAPPDDAQIIVLRVVIRSPDVPTFISKYSRFLKDDRIFIFTKASQPPGTRVRFTLELADGPPLVHGEGVVMRTRPDSGDSTKPPGMELRFRPLDDQSQQMVDRMIEARNASSSIPIALPPPIPPPLPPVPSVGTGPLGGMPTPVHPDASEEARTDVRDPLGPLPPLTPAAGTVNPDAGNGRKYDSGSVTPLPEPLPPPTMATSETEAQSIAALEGTGEPAAPGRPLEAGRSTRAELPALALTPPLGVAHQIEETFTGGDGTPRFAESYVGVLPPPPGAPSASQGMVPANPFSEVSDNAIEYFVEWSMEQTTAPHKVPQRTAFKNVVMKPPTAEKPATGGWLRLWIGLLLGLLVGVPLGAAAMWTLHPLPLAEDLPRVPVPRPLARSVPKRSEPVAPAPAPVAAAPAPVAAPPVAAAEPKPAEAKPAEAAPEPAKAELPAPPPLPPSKGHLATLRVRSTPPGAEVSVKGEPRGTAPVEVELPPNHRYEIVVTTPGKAAWKKRINLKPPLTEVNAVLR